MLRMERKNMLQHRFAGKWVSGRTHAVFFVGNALTSGFLAEMCSLGLKVTNFFFQESTPCVRTMGERGRERGMKNTKKVVFSQNLVRVSFSFKNIARFGISALFYPRSPIFSPYLTWYGGGADFCTQNQHI